MTLAFFILLGVVAAALGSLLFSTLTYSLRDFSRARLTEFLEARGNTRWLEPTLHHVNDLIFITAVFRLLMNMLVLLFTLRMMEETPQRHIIQYVLAVLMTIAITLFSSVAVPHALARHAGGQIIGFFAPMLHFLRIMLAPLSGLMRAIDSAVARATSGADRPDGEKIEQEIQEEILSAVEDGAKEGVVDAQEREMIESVIQFRNVQVRQVMSARTEISGLDVKAKLEEVKIALEKSGHSRLPVYQGTLDHIVGVLYARDLLQYLGQPPEQFDMRSAMRPAYYVPESKPLRDLLQDFRHQKVHIAIVLDEYGGTAGLVTIEDLLEELVGEISDEHEATEPAMMKRINEQTWEADARVYIDELNRVLGLNLPDEAGYDTLGGFVSTTVGRIPSTGTFFEHAGIKYTILEAEPQKVNRVRIELTLQSAAPGLPSGA